MAYNYNKALEEKKWHMWKEAEERKLRGLGVSEDVIKRLYEADWNDFKSERRFLEHYADTDTYLNWQVAPEPQLDIHTVEDLLCDIENEELFRVMSTADMLTLRIVVFMMKGLTMRKIAKELNLGEKAVYRRIERLREKNII